MQSNICIVSIQILRRYAPQNDELLNCSQLRNRLGCAKLAATQVEKWELVVQCSVGEEIRRSAVRAEAPPCGGSQILAPRTSARKHLPYLCQNRDRLRPAQLCELQNHKKTGSQTTIPLTLPRHYAASGLLNLPAALTRPFPQKMRAESSKHA